MILLRFLLPQLTPDASRKARDRPRARILTGYSRRRFTVRNAMTSQNYYNLELRPVLEHLLAARLAERHGVHLYQDPDAARRLLCRNPRDAAERALDELAAALAAAGAPRSEPAEAEAGP